MILFHVHDGSALPPTMRDLGHGWTAAAIGLDRLGDDAIATRHCVFEVDLHDLAAVGAVRGARRKLDGLRIFALGSGDRHAAVQAAALGATHTVNLPVTDEALRQILSASGPDDAGPRSAALGAIALDGAFRAVRDGAAFDGATFEAVTTGLLADLDDVGVASWLASIRDHHAGTYLHCLLVTGVAAAFGGRLGLVPTDLRVLTEAALLHDIGKARIDRRILDKPGRLDPAEMTVIRRHPEWGEAYLRERSEVSPAIRAAVRHHHEYLDGSGYPDGLAGSAISDLTRLVTVADIFGALIEPRPYKPPMSARAAYQHLRDLSAAGKLEPALVDAFEAVAVDLAPLGGNAPRPATRLGGFARRIATRLRA